MLAPTVYTRLCFCPKCHSARTLPGTPEGDETCADCGRERRSAEGFVQVLSSLQVARYNCNRDTRLDCWREGAYGAVETAIGRTMTAMGVDFCAPLPPTMECDLLDAAAMGTEAVARVYRKAFGFPHC